MVTNHNTPILVTITDKATEILLVPITISLFPVMRDGVADTPVVVAMLTATTVTDSIIPPGKNMVTKKRYEVSRKTRPVAVVRPMQRLCFRIQSCCESSFTTLEPSINFIFTKGNNVMSRNHFTLGMLAAAFTLLLIASEADARGCRNHRRHNNCCQSNYNYGHHYHRRYHQGNCCNQQVNYAPTTACCTTHPTGCDIQSAYNTRDVEQNGETSRTTMRPAPQLAPAPAPEPEIDPLKE